MSDIRQLAREAGQAVTTYRSSTNPHWNDSYLNMGAQLMQQKLENEQQLELWNLTNAYNSPQAQMQRFKDAGLNPNLIYHQGTPGNANSQPGYSHANYQLSPHADTATRIQSAMQVLGMINNMVNNVASIYETGYDIRMKRNQVALSDLDVMQARHVFPAFQSGGMSTNYNMATLSDSLNPMSSKFDPMAFVYFSKNGQLPQFMNQYLTGAANRSLTGFRSDYQKYYNEHLLPVFKEYQEGKRDLQNIDKDLAEYRKTALEMMPPELRGILEPIFNYLGPFVKFIFKFRR